MAYEIAASLRRRGKDIEYLGVIDALPVLSESVTDVVPWYRGVQSLYGKILDTNWNKLDKTPVNAGITEILAQVIEKKIIPGTDPQVARQHLEYLCSMSCSMNEYRSSKSEIDVNLYLSTDSEEHDLSAPEELTSVALWRKATSGSITKSYTGGKHADMVSHPHVHRLALRVTKHLLGL